MRRPLLIIAVSAGLGIAITASSPLGRAIAQQVVERCVNTHAVQKRYPHLSEKRKKEIADWNREHPEWVRRWKARQNLSILCAEIEHEYESKSILGGEDNPFGVVPSALPVRGGDVEVISEGVAGISQSDLLADEVYPTYDSPSRSLPDDDDSYNGGFVGIGGFTPVGKLPTPPVVAPPPPSTSTVSETGTMSMMLIGMAAGIWTTNMSRNSKKKEGKTT